MPLEYEIFIDACSLVCQTKKAERSFHAKRPVPLTIAIWREGPENLICIGCRRLIFIMDSISLSGVLNVAQPCRSGVGNEDLATKQPSLWFIILVTQIV